jgi:hypothetical protein
MKKYILIAIVATVTTAYYKNIHPTLGIEKS